MSDTGATPEQIEAAMSRFRDDRENWMCYMSALVPPDHRIIGPDDLAALRRVIGDVRVIPDRAFFGCDTTDEDIARLDALLGTGLSGDGDAWKAGQG
jgi:hypothetical protein